METVSPALQDDSSGANPSSIKSDDSSPRPESGRGSPPPNCAICLGTCRNKSFTDSCLHQFCFKCLLTWSKVKAECPLCKQNFRSIIHNVRSNHQYEEYMVEQSQVEESVESVDFDNIVTAARRFRYRTTLTLPRRETLAIQQLLLHYPLMADMFSAPVAASRPPVARRRRSPASFRRTVYRHNLWARPLPDFTGRFRDCSPDFYRYNNTQMHRLVPWLNRELHYLLNENIGHISYVMARILELLPQHHINSLEFREGMQRYFGERTEHFLHELYCFASTPYDMTGYDRNVQYTTDTRISTMINEVISSTDSDASVDSDIVMVSSSEPAEPPPAPGPGPSRQPAPVYPQNYIPQPNTINVIPIETISQSDSDDDSSEVMVVGYIKPPQERTPEIVDLLGSDSDVILQDNVQPEPSQNLDSTERPIPLVKLSLKRHRGREVGDSDSDDSSYRPPVSRRKRRHRSNETATTSDTCRATPSPAASSASSPPARTPSPSCTPPRPPHPHPLLAEPTASTSTCAPTPASISTSTSACSPSPTSAAPFPNELDSIDGSDSSNRSYSSNHRKSKITKRKTKKKSTKEVRNHSKDKKKNKKSSSTHHNKKEDRKKSDESQLERDKQSKRKSHLGKGVKSSKKNEATTEAPAEAPPAEQQPGPSGTTATRRRKLSKERKRHRPTHESKRLRSVVNVMYSHKNTGESSSSGTSNSYNDEAVDDKNRRVRDDKGNSGSSDDERLIRGRADSSDSEDDLPLNLTVQKSQEALSCL